MNARRERETRRPEGREGTDVDAAAVARGAVLVLAAIGLVLAGVRLAIDPGSEPAPGTRALWTTDERVAGPRLQLAPRAELEALEHAQRARLTSYGWVDREAGVAHIPIEAAMRRLAERGLDLEREPAPDPAEPGP